MAMPIHDCAIADGILFAGMPQRLACVSNAFAKPVRAGEIPDERGESRDLVELKYGGEGGIRAYGDTDLPQFADIRSVTPLKRSDLIYAEARENAVLMRVEEGPKSGQIGRE